MSKNEKINLELKKVRLQITEISRKALMLAKVSERELKKLSHHGSLHFDTTALNLRLERLYYLIGKEYVLNRKSSEPSVKLTKLLDEVEGINSEYQLIISKKKAEI